MREFLINLANFFYLSFMKNNNKRWKALYIFIWKEHDDKINEVNSNNNYNNNDSAK
jgi:hypothetical protein